MTNKLIELGVTEKICCKMKKRVFNVTELTDKTDNVTRDGNTQDACCGKTNEEEEEEEPLPQSFCTTCSFVYICAPMSNLRYC